MSDTDSRTSPRRVSDDAIDAAVAVLRRGGVIVMPTDTVYGIAAALDHSDAIERIFVVKGRSGTKAIPILVSSTTALDDLTRPGNDRAARLARRLWPGAL